MKRRSFERSRWFVMAMIIALTVVLLGGIFGVLAAPSEVPSERPPAALYSITWNSTVITQNTNSSAYLTQNYAYQDVSCAFDFRDAQGVTVTLQASPDNVNWFRTHIWTGYTTDTTAITGLFSRTLSYTRYERMRFLVDTGLSVTPTCKSTYFNNWMPFDNVVTGGRAVPE